MPSFHDYAAHYALVVFTDLEELIDDRSTLGSLVADRAEGFSPAQLIFIDKSGDVRLGKPDAGTPDAGTAILAVHPDTDEPCGNALQNVVTNWREQGRAILVASHGSTELHQATHSVLSLGSRDHLRKYSHGQGLGHVVWPAFVHFLRAAIAGNPDQFERTFVELVDGIRLTKADGLLTLKHRLSHLFLPIETDLQGLREAGFAEDYWNEVAKTYEGGKATDRLDQARSLLFGTSESARTVEAIANEFSAINSPLPAPNRKSVEDAWDAIAEQLPLVSASFPSAVWDIIRWIEVKDRRMDVQLADGGRAFSKWYACLERLLDELWYALRVGDSREPREG